MKVIEQVHTEWKSTIVFVLKKHGTLRLCVDHPTLIAVTIRDSYLSLRMDKSIASLGDAKIFSPLHGNSEY